MALLILPRGAGRNLREECGPWAMQALTIADVYFSALKENTQMSLPVTPRGTWSSADRQLFI